MTDTHAVSRISSRDNAWLKQLRRLAHDAGAYRRQGQVWLEGDHLCRSAATRGRRAQVAVFAEEAYARAEPALLQAADRVVVLPETLFDSISGLESPSRMGYVMALDIPPPLEPAAPSVILDRLQDAGNVGSILRCAAAFGLRQVVALKGTAALWSPKVLRAGMGAHFGLHLIESASPDLLDRLEIPLVTTSSHAGEWLHRCRLPWPCAWVMGHEGQGVGAELAARAAVAVRIAQPGGEESLNVAAAAAICLHASAVQQLG